MKEKRMMEWLENIDEKYIEEANPKNRKVFKFRRNMIVAAACLCFVVLVGIGGGFYGQATEKEKFYSTNMEEIMSIIESERL